MGSRWSNFVGKVGGVPGASKKGQSGFSGSSALVMVGVCMGPLFPVILGNCLGSLHWYIWKPAGMFVVVTLSVILRFLCWPFEGMPGKSVLVWLGSVLNTPQDKGLLGYLPFRFGGCDETPCWSSSRSSGASCPVMLIVYLGSPSWSG